MKYVALASFLALMAAVFAAFSLPPSHEPPVGYRKIDVTLRETQWLRKQVELFHERNGGFPSNDAGLYALLKTTPPLLEKVPSDVWGNSYIYRQSSKGEGFLIYSVGLNGTDEGGANDDVTDSSKSYSCAEYEVDCPLKRSDFVRYGILACLLFALPTLLVSLGVLVYRREQSHAA